MLKFFRKNEKLSRWFLIVGMTLLMVSWLVFDQSSSFFTDMLVGRSTWATTTDGGSITESNRVYLQQQTRAIAAMGDPTARALGIDKDPVHWFLLTLEAKQAGLVGGESDGRARIAEIAAANKVPEMNLIGGLCRESGLTPGQLFETIAQLSGVDRYVNLVSSGPARLSTPRLEQTAASLLLGVTGEIVVLDGVKSKVDVGAPTDAAIATQLSTYGSDAPGTGKYGFGYRVADRVRMEWMTIASSAVTELVEKSPALSALELRKYWLEHPGEFPAAQISATPPTFESVRAAVRSKVLAATLAAKRQEIGKFISDRLQLSLRGVPQVNGYFSLPADWASHELALSTLASEVAAQFGLPTPAVEASGESWTELAAIDGMPTLGMAETRRFGSTPVRASQLIQALREFGGKSTVVMQARVASPVMETPSGDLVVLRVTEAQAAAAPTSVDGVKEALVADLNRVARFGKLEAQMPEIEKVADDQGLAVVAANFGIDAQPFTELRQSDKQFLQYGLKLPGQLPSLGADPVVTKAIVDRAMALPSGKPITDLPLADRTLVVASPDKLAVAVARIDSVTPMNAGDLAPLRTNPRFRTIAATDPSLGSPADLFTLEQLKARHGFAYSNPRESEEDAPAEGDAATPAKAAS